MHVVQNLTSVSEMDGKSLVLPKHGIMVSITISGSRNSSCSLAKFKSRAFLKNSTPFLANGIDIPSVVHYSLKLLKWDKLCASVASFAGTSFGKHPTKARLWLLNQTYKESMRLLGETNAAFEMHNLWIFMKPGNVSMQLSRALSGITNLLFNRRNNDELAGIKRELLRPGKVSPRRLVPNDIPRPSYVKSRKPPGIFGGPEVHDQMGIECMRASGRLAAQVLEYAGTLVKPSITTDEIDQAVHQMIIDNGAYPSPLGYGGFPKSVCTSVNECICHGIPDSRALEEGDIVNIDVTVYLNGYHGDTSKTFYCGEVDDEAKKLVQVTKECLDKAISICAPGVEYKKIGKKIQDHADSHRYGVVKQFVGHGVGRVFHADPVIMHYRNKDPGRMILNQTFTIEPMLTIGSINPIMWDDNWTVVTEDGSLSAQFEHTILITPDGAEILTQC